MVIGVASNVVSNARVKGSFTDTIIKFIFILIAFVVVIVGVFVIRFLFDPVGFVEGAATSVRDTVFPLSPFGLVTSLLSPLAGVLALTSRL